MCPRDYGHTLPKQMNRYIDCAVDLVNRVLRLNIDIDAMD